MKTAALSTSGIPDGLLALVLTIVIVVIVACAALVLFTNHRDKVKDRENAEGLRRMQNLSDTPSRGDDSLNDVAPDEKSSTRPRKPEAPR